MPSSASLLLALVFFAGIFEIEPSAPPRATLLRRAEHASVSQIVGSGGGVPHTTTRLANHYLLLVNSAVASQLDAQKLAQFDRSPYDGLAVSFGDAFDASTVRSAETMEAQIAVWKKFTTKDIWP